MSAQEGAYVEVRDLETWSSVGIKLNLDKKWGFGVSEQLRLKTNSSIVSSYFTAFKINYIGWKRWELGGGFRFLRDNDTEGDVHGFENHSRYHVELGYKHKVNRIKLAYRLRFQRKNE